LIWDLQLVSQHVFIILVNNHNNSFLITNLNKNNIKPIDHTEKISIGAAELILVEDYIIIVPDPVFYLISYLIIKRNIMFVASQAIGLQEIF
jgi:hypothetical protein